MPLSDTSRGNPTIKLLHHSEDAEVETVIKDRRTLFEAYDKHRFHEVYCTNDFRPVHHKTVSEHTLSRIKAETYLRIKNLRLGREDMLSADDLYKIEKQKKFMNFIANLNTRAALRKWKD